MAGDLHFVSDEASTFIDQIGHDLSQRMKLPTVVCRKFSIWAGKSYGKQPVGCQVWHISIIASCASRGQGTGWRPLWPYKPRRRKRPLPRPRAIFTIKSAGRQCAKTFMPKSAFHEMSCSSRAHTTQPLLDLVHVRLHKAVCSTGKLSSFVPQLRLKKPV